MDNIFAIGDIHGKRQMLETMLTKWNVDNEQLVLLGDLIDRGEDGYGVIHLVKQLKETYGAVILQGNHEEMFLNWLDMPFSEMDLYYGNGGRETLHSFFDRKITFTHMPNYIADLLKSQFIDEIDFLKGLPSYFEWKDYVFVHAGVNLVYKDWKNSSETEFRWIREPFHYGKNETGKTFVFGHTPTFFLNKNESFDVWISPCKTKIGIDGGAVFGGKLHALSIKDGELIFHSLDKDLNFTLKTEKVPV